MRARATIRTLGILALAAVAAACSDLQLRDDPGNPAAAGGPPAVSSGTFSCGDTAAVSGSPMERLSKAQYRNTLLALFGQSVVDDIQPMLDAIPVDGDIEQPTEFVNNFQAPNLSSFFKIATRIAHDVASDPTKLAAVGADCLAASADDACLSSVVASVGRRAFRRPLAADEVSSIAALAGPAITAEGRVSAILEYLLEAPDFLYRVEQGAPAASGKFKLTAYELAARLSYLLWDSPPDAELDALADAGKLDDAETLDREVDRMLEDPRAHAKLADFVRYWLELFPETPHSMRALPTGPAAYLAGLDTTGLRDEIVREATEYFDYVVFGLHGSWADLMTSNVSFARTDSLASIYGHPKVTTTSPAQMGGTRKGLLMRPFFLSNNSAETNPIIRGVRSSSRILCMTMTAPTVDVRNQGPDTGTLDMIQNHSVRERVVLKTAGPACAGCHAAINPFGFVFEGLDSVGRMRTQELDYGADGSVIATHAIDTSATVKVGSETWNLAGPEDYVEHLARSEVATSCFVSHLSRFYSLRFESPEDGCRLSAMHLALTKPKGTIRDAIKQMFVYPTIDVRRPN